MTHIKYAFDAHDDVYALAGQRGVTKSYVFEAAIDYTSRSPDAIGLALSRRVGMGEAKMSRRTVNIRPSTKALLVQLSTMLRLSTEEVARLSIEAYLNDVPS